MKQSHLLIGLCLWLFFTPFFLKAQSIEELEAQAIDYAGKRTRQAADVYEKLGNAYFAIGEKKKALTSFYKASKIFATINPKENSEILSKAGYIFHKNKQYADAIPLFIQSLDIARRYGLRDLVKKNASHLAEAYQRTGNDAKAERYSQMSSDYSNSSSRQAELQQKIAASKNKNELGDLKMQLEQLRNDSIIRALKETESIALLKIQADSIRYIQEENEAQEAALQRQEDLLEKNRLKIDNQKSVNLIYAVSLVAVAIIMVIAIIFFINSRRKNLQLSIQNERIRLQSEEIEAQKKQVEKEKHKADELLNNILPEEVAAELKDKGYATPRFYEQVTVLFTDFKGFTNITEKMSPEQVIKELDEVFLAFDYICDRYNLEKIKTIGDAYMCAGGIPIANNTNHIDAVRAGLAMQEFMDTLKTRKIMRGDPYFELRLGINTGAIVAGVVGKNKFAYDIWGDTVNIASRMESSGEVTKVNISGSTYELVKDAFNCTHRGKISAKSKGEIDMYFVENEK